MTRQLTNLKQSKIKHRQADIKLASKMNGNRVHVDYQF